MSASFARSRPTSCRRLPAFNGLRAGEKFANEIDDRQGEWMIVINGATLCNLLPQRHLREGRSFHIGELEFQFHAPALITFAIWIDNS